MSTQKKRQMSESFILMLFITLSGGFQDAYTYMGRGQVFANAQTGNIVLMSANLFEGNFAVVLRYLAPLVAFAGGVYVAEFIRQHYHNRPRFHWRQLVIILEIVILFAVGFIPNSKDTLANVLVSFVCAMQVQSFRKINGNPYASTMCIGNLRSGTDHFYAWIHNHKRSSLRKAFEYFRVIFLFAIGAGLGSLCTNKLGNLSIWGSCLLLIVGFGIMFIAEDET